MNSGVGVASQDGRRIITTDSLYLDNAPHYAHCNSENYMQKPMSCDMHALGFNFTSNMQHVNPYQNRVLCRVYKTLGKNHFTLDKVKYRVYWANILSAKDYLPSTSFRKKNTRQRKTLGKLRIEKNQKTAKHFFKL
jgi:hypothetical protein